MTYAQRLHLKRVLSSLVTAILSISMLGAISTISTPTASAVSALATCANGSLAQNSITVEPSHPSVMYIDSGITPAVDAAYIGYRVSNRTGATLKGYWASLDNFTGNVISLANPLDKYIQLPEILNGETKTVYFLVKAATGTSTPQAHDFKVWNKYPDASTANDLYKCNFAFSKVAETIKASPNKPTGTTVSPPGTIGTTFTVTSTGDTGQIGQGNTDVGRILWFTPAAFSNFPTRSFRLESVLLRVTSGNGGTAKNWYFKDRTYIKTTTLPNAMDGVTGEETTANLLTGAQSYINVYTFRIIDAGSATIAPVAQISSGKMIKHSATNSKSTAPITVTNSTIPATITKELSSTSYSTFETNTIGGTQYTAIPYKITLKGSGGEITADQVVDLPPTGAIYKAGSTQISINGATPTAYADPETLTSESLLSPRPLHFTGPFTFSSTSFVVLTYKMYLPAVAGIYSNSATAFIGDRRIISSTSAAIPAVRVTLNEAGTVTTSELTTVKLLPDPLTKVASSIDTTIATINGAINANDTTTSGFFEWGTSPTLSSVTTTNSEAVSGITFSNLTSALTGLSPGTTYYFRVVAVSFGVRYPGAILNFRTLDQISTPTITTDAPTSVTLTDATLNATVDPNLTQVKVAFAVWRTNDTVTVTVVDDLSIALDENTNSNTYNPYSLYAGASPSGVSINMSDLFTTSRSTPSTDLRNWIVADATIYYKAIITPTSGSPIAATETKQFTFATYNDQVIAFDPIGDITFGDPAPVDSASATSGLDVTFSSLSAEVCTVTSAGVITVITAGDCIIAANQPGGFKIAGEYYNPAPEVTQIFSILPRQITITADAKGKEYSAVDPAFTYEITLGSLVGSDTFTGTLARTPGEALGVYSINQGSVALSANYALSYLPADLTIDPKPITITASVKTKIYGESDPELTYVLSSPLKSGDTFTGTLARSPGASVGAYPISQGNLAASSNYELSFIGETLTITTAPLIVRAEGKTRAQGEPEPAFTYSLTGLVGSDSITAVTLIFTSSGTTSPSITSGTDIITPSEPVFAAGSFASNYSITYETATYLVTNKLGQVITWTGIPTKVYGDTATAIATSDINTLIASITSLTPTICTVPESSLSGAVVTILGTGTCELHASQAGDETYAAASDATTTFDIDPKPITVTASSHMVTVGDPIPGITDSYSPFAFSETKANLIGLIECSTTYTTSSSTGTYPTNCSGLSSPNYQIFYVPGLITVIAPSSETTYSISYQLNGGSGTTPTETAKAAGQTFITASSAEFTRGGYDFAGWSCNSVTRGQGDLVTVGAAEITCVAIWNKKSDPKPLSPSKDTSEKKRAKVDLVTIGTTPVKSIATPTTPKDPDAPAGMALSETTEIPTTGTKAITFVGVGISKVAVVDDEVFIAARRGFSGKTVVLITFTDDSEISEITATVWVNPLPVSKPVVRAINEVTTRVSWGRSPNAIGYEVSQDETVLCKTSSAACVLKVPLSPDSPLEIKALGKDQTESVVRQATYTPKPAKQEIPEIALVVNFDTAKFNIDAQDRILIRAFAANILKYGYKEVDISGHTDSRGGIDNNVLSNNRAKASRDFLLKLLPDLKVTINGYADALSVAPNKTTAGMAANRRAEFRIVA